MLHSSQQIFEVFRDGAQKAGEKDALLYKQKAHYESISYIALLRQAAAFARVLHNHQISPGDKVALVLENRPEFAGAVMAVWACGAVAVPLDVQYSTLEIKTLLKHSQARLVVSQQRLFHLHEELRSICPWLTVDDPDLKYHLREAAGSARAVELEHSPAVDLAALFYTSGTTGEPKAVMLSHANILSNVRAFHQLEIASSKDVVVSVLPLHHTYAFTTTLLYPLLIGATVSYPKSIASVDLLSCIRETCATVFVGVPQIFKHMHKAVVDRIGGMKALKRSMVLAAGELCMNSRKVLGANPGRVLFSQIHHQFGPSLRLMVSGGAKLDPEISRDFYRWGFSLIEGYGLTETSPVVSFSLPNQAKFGSVGRVIPGVGVDIKDPDAAGIGEVLVKGPNVMMGYYRNQAETDRVLYDGWFHTGDLGYIDRDGFLFLTGRSKEILVLENGENINPEELENYYGQNPFIKEIAVLSFKAERSSGVTAEKLVALIVADQDHFLAQKETNIKARIKWELENMCVHMPSYKRVTGFEVSQEELPRTRLGKLRRFELPEIYARLRERSQVKQRVQIVEPVEGRSELFDQALGYLEDAVGRPVGLKEHLELDVGLDSLGRMELLLGLQEKLGLSLTEEQSMQFFVCVTVEDLLDKLREFSASLPSGIAVDEDAKILSGLSAGRENFAVVAERAKSFLREALNRESIQESDHLELDLGLDSLGRMEVLLSLQERLGLTMSDEQAVGFFMASTVAELLENLKKELPRMQEGSGAKAFMWSDILRQDPDADKLKRINTGDFSLPARLFNVAGWCFFRAFFKLFYRLKVEGLENANTEGPFLICSNHTTYFDALIILSALPFRKFLQVFFLGDSKFLNHPVLRPFGRAARFIPIEFTHNMVEALKVCAYVLRNQKIVCYFPEGQRSIDGEVKEFRKGVGVLVKELGVPVLPAFISGAFECWPRGQRFPKLFGNVTLRFGKMTSSKELLFRVFDAEDDYEQTAENLRIRVSSLK
ncbi:MAG TPA: AMP-binding protein [Candidatus Omnitrophota bacterium]|nr:AMP-binding protein [Candidatus Omnitrophota bacterium]